MASRDIPSSLILKACSRVFAEMLVLSLSARRTVGTFNRRSAQTSVKDMPRCTLLIRMSRVVWSRALSLVDSIYIHHIATEMEDKDHYLRLDGL
jgi:hypothetical protein